MQNPVNQFIKTVLAIDLGLFLAAGLLALILNIDFGVILLFTGILAGGTGAFLSRPSPDDNPANLISVQSRLRTRPLQNLLDASAYNIKHALPDYAFENALTLAGLIATILSVPLMILFLK